MIHGTGGQGKPAGNPPDPGQYACKTFSGWKILAWHKGEWWTDNLAARYVPDVDQWIGPLPGTTPAALEFDL